MLAEALPELRNAPSLQDALEKGREGEGDHLALDEGKRHERDLERLRGELAIARSERILRSRINCRSSKRSGRKPSACCGWPNRLGSTPWNRASRRRKRCSGT